MGLQDPYGSDRVSDYDERTGSFDHGNDGRGDSFGPQTQTEAYSTPPVGPIQQTPEEVIRAQYYENMAATNPKLSQLVGAGLGLATGNPMGLAKTIKDYIASAGKSKEQTIQDFVDTGMSQAEAEDLFDYSVTSGSQTPSGPADHDSSSGFLNPYNTSGGGGSGGSGGGGYGSMEEYIRAINPQAQDLLRGGTETALSREQQALNESLGMLSPYAGEEAFREISALTGAMGESAQKQAISGIPMTASQKALNEREQRQKMRLAGAKGRAGGGATIQEMINLGGQQQAKTVSDRISALQPISDINRQTASTMSGLEEGSLTRQAQLEQQLGPQLAAILLGQVGPITETRSSAAELSGLQNVNEANQNAQLMGQIAEMIGSWGGNDAN